MKRGHWHQRSDERLGDPPCATRSLYQVNDKDRRLLRGPPGGAMQKQCTAAESAWAEQVCGV